MENKKKRVQGYYHSCKLFSASTENIKIVEKKKIGHLIPTSKRGEGESLTS